MTYQNRIQPRSSLHGEPALVTGASKGIGEAVARGPAGLAVFLVSNKAASGAGGNDKVGDVYPAS